MDWEKIKIKEKRKKNKKKETPIWLPLLVFIAVIAVFSSVVFLYLGLEFADFRKTGNWQEMGNTNKDKLIERAFTIIGGGIAVLGLFALIWRSILMERQTEISRKQVENVKEQVKHMEKQAKSMERQAKITQKGQNSERFVKSVEQLANKDLGIFLGGLASLDSLSNEGKKEYRRVWKYLGDFLRHHDSLKDKGEKPHPKVNAIAKMLRERNTDYEDGSFKLDLSYAHLEGAYLVGANLKRVDFFGANLKGVDFFGAILEGVDFSRANLDSATLRCANLDSATLRFVSLDKAKFKTALFGRRISVFFGGTEAQDLTDLTHEQLRGTYYDIAGLEPKLPDGISEEDKPKPISYRDWFEQYRYWLDF